MVPTSAYPLTTLESRLGFERGYGRDTTAFTAAQRETIEACWFSGTNLFYHSGDEWSFLHPSRELALEDGADSVALPGDLGGLEGLVFVTGPTGQTFRPPLDPVLDEVVFGKRAELPTTTGRPELVAQTPTRGQTPGGIQGSALIVWPTADQAYTLRVRYYLTPAALTAAMPYAYGGAEHGETILAACMYASERDVDGLKDGRWFGEYQRLLQVSRQLDRRRKPQTLGRNGTGQNWYAADRRGGSGSWPYAGVPAWTYNGVSY